MKNNWKEIDKARRGPSNPRRAFWKGVGVGVLVIVTTLICFGWWMFWPLP